MASPSRVLVERLHSGDLDAGFFVSFVPSEPLKTLLDDPRIRLLSIDTRKSVGLLNAGLRLSKIGTEAGYGSQLEGEPDIDTVATRAVLVARADLPSGDVRQITKALFDGAPLLGVRGGAEAMGEDLPGLPLHRGARKYLQPDPDPYRWLERLLAANWKFLASLVILVGAFQGLLKLKRDTTSNNIGKEILKIPLDESEPESVRKLLKIRDHLPILVRRRLYEKEQLDQSRFRYLNALINDRIKQAKENLTADVAERLRNLEEEEHLDSAARRQRLRDIRRRVWDYFQGGELDASHQAMLLEMIREGTGPRNE